MEKIKKIAVSSLGKTIKNETLAYINKMNGQGVSNLHNLFITEAEKSLISNVCCDIEPYLSLCSLPLAFSPVTNCL